MTKSNLDKLFQEKLEGSQCEYKGEYWTQMQKMINTSSLSQVANSATQASAGISTFAISLIAATAVIIGAITLYIFKSNSDDTSDINQQTIEISNEINTSSNHTSNFTQTEQSTLTSNNKEQNTLNASKNTVSINSKNNNKSYKANSDKPSAAASSATKSSAAASSTFKAIPVENTDLFTKPNSELVEETTTNNCVEYNINTIKIETLDIESLEEPIEIESEENIIPIVLMDYDNAPLEQTKEKHSTNDNNIDDEILQDNSKVKNVKPMRKPSGKIFRKKGGLFKWLSKKK